MRALCTALCIPLVSACDAPREAVDAWLACEECPGELAEVLRHGDDALEPLMVALYRGAPAPELRNFAAQSAEQYRLAHRAALAPHGSLSALSDSATFVANSVSGLIQGFQLRAAWAVRALDTPAARAALHQAALDHASGFLGWQSAVETLVAQLDANEPVTGITVSAPVRVLAVGDSVQLSALVHGPVGVPQTVAWVSQAAVAVTVNATGLASRVGAGNVAVRACSTVAPTVCGRIVIGMP